MTDRTPLGYGRGTHVDADTIEATFPLGLDMDGWKMTSAEVDPSGYFLSITFHRESL